MKHHRSFLSLLAVAVGFTTPSLLADEPDLDRIQIGVAKLLEQGHYSRQRLNDKVSKRFLNNYLEALDYNHLFFLQSDVDEFRSKYEKTLDDDLEQGAIAPAFEIFDRYKKRVEDRIAKVKEFLKQEYDFKSDRTVQINRQKAPWPKDEAEADQIWRNRIENELLQEKLGKLTTPSVAETKNPGDKQVATPDSEPVVKVAPADPVERLTKRYNQILRNLNEQTREDINKSYLSVLAQTYDPHSEYLSRSELENFSINMRLSLVGIGAVLNSEDGYAKIMELVPGGPASKDGRLKVGDRISGVAQGKNEFVDTVDMKLDKVVEMIRGKKDTVVRLQVLPVRATDPSLRKIIDITRDEIKLKEQEAKAEIIERPLPDGTVQRLGWITLPSFYADMERSGAPNAKSTTKDVQALLTRLKKENINGLVMDLRRDGGGSLEEAINLTGLFIKKGPVVQSKNANGEMTVNFDHDSSIAYEGPMIVLTNRLSASASEIFAAALQDYGRALVVGDSSTFGKGTVQTMLEIGRIVPYLRSANGNSNEAGALKLTIQKFYRIAGGSTQLEGVIPDVKLPSPTDHPEIGESALKDPLPYDTVEPREFDKWPQPLFKNELGQRSAARIATDPEFGYIKEDNDLVNDRIARNTLSLNLEQRKSELEEQKSRRTARKEARAKRAPSDEKRYSITLDTVNAPKLELVKSDDETDKANDAAVDVEDDADADVDSDAPIRVDPIRDETLNILVDLVEMSHGPKTAQASPKKK
ncbi:MAG: carboxy terminal-processing peptidase [Chthoniobacteraceae bacterium]